MLILLSKKVDTNNPHIILVLPPSFHQKYGATITMPVDPTSTTIEDLKEDIKEELGLLPEDESISFDTNELTDNAKQLDSYGVESGNQIDLVTLGVNS